MGSNGSDLLDAVLQHADHGPGGAQSTQPGGCRRGLGGLDRQEEHIRLLGLRSRIGAHGAGNDDPAVVVDQGELCSRRATVERRCVACLM